MLLMTRLEDPWLWKPVGSAVVKREEMICEVEREM